MSSNLFFKIGTCQKYAPAELQPGTNELPKQDALDTLLLAIVSLLFRQTTPYSYQQTGQ